MEYFFTIIIIIITNIFILFNAVIITVLCVSLCVLLGALVELADGATVVEGHVSRGDGHVTKHQ